MSKFSRKCVMSLTGAAGAMALVASLSSPMMAAADAGGDPAAEALAKERGMSVSQAKKQLARETKQSTTARTLTSSLGADRSAGSWIDADGNLNVAVTDQASAAKVTESGAKAVVVKHSTNDLTKITDELTKAAKAGAVDDLQSWSVDVKTNQVVVKTTGAVTEGTSKSITTAAKSNDALRVEKTKGKMTLAANLYGGREYQVNGQWLCSSGFNATDSSGQTVMVTAGHCAEGASEFTMDGTDLGTLRGYSFPEDDYAAVNVNSSWEGRGVVDMYDGRGVVVEGSEEAAIGATLCKSGRTSNWTCGEIVSEDNTVNYGDGDVVSGLVEHNACVEQGDSGGANIAGSQAQGMSSGGQLYQDGSGLVCGEKVGEENVSYYQPVNEALDEYGLTLITE